MYFSAQNTANKALQINLMAVWVDYPTLRKFG